MKSNKKKTVNGELNENKDENKFKFYLIPQIALAIGVLTSNRQGWCTSSKIGRGAVAGCHCWG